MASKSLPADSTAPATPARAIPLDALIALLVLYFLWGSTYLGIKVALISFPPFLMGGIRFTLAGICMFVFLLLRRTALPTRRQWLHAAIFGGLLIVGGNGMVAFAEQYVSSSLTAAVLAASPFAFAVFSGLFGKWPNKIEWIGIAIGFTGVLLLNVQGELRGQPLGAFALLIGMLSWAFGSVLGREKLDLPGGAMTSASEMLLGGPMLLAAGLLRGEQFAGPIAPEAMAGFVYLFFAAIVGFTSYNLVLRKLRPALASSYSYVNPVVALILGVVLLGETVTPFSLIAIGIIIAGVAFITLAKRSNK
jgi:drug/metabolite transporter (DMT)-like permease